jgi:hypothetical protein
MFALAWSGAARPQSAVLAGNGAAAAARPQSAAPSRSTQAAEVAGLEPAVDVGRRTAGAGGEAGARGGVSRPAETPPRAPRRVDLGTTSITGNQELPKVLYIVPWKKADLGAAAGRPVNTLIDDVLAPVDPDVFKRKLAYYDELFDSPRPGGAEPAEDKE